jgi:hypothetical protein
MTSPIDKLFREMFGDLPSKPGAAYERLAAIALHVLEEGKVKHDVRLKGQFSNTSYQLDAHHESAKDGTATMAEAKDYSEQGDKVDVLTFRSSAARCRTSVRLMRERSFLQRGTRSPLKSTLKLHAKSPAERE